MPTFTAVALDTLLEPKPQKMTSKPPVPRPVTKQASPEKKINHAYVSPTLYRTPEATPLPDSPKSFPPSPYIVNYKRRGPRLLKSPPRNSAVAGEQNDKTWVRNDGKATDSVSSVSAPEMASGSPEEVCVSISNGRKHEENVSGNGLDVAVDVTKSATADVEIDSDIDDFFDPQDAMSVGSSLDVDDNAGTEQSLKPTNSSEFYDASEDLSIESSPRSSNVEHELGKLRTTPMIEIEIERRNQVQEALCHMQNQWERLSEKLSLVGLSLPAAPLADKNEQREIDPAEELCQQVIVARAVANSIGRGEARAEVELEMESQLEAKNFEINRLWDRLRYYETMNHEMSQRNQETVERARQQRYKRKRNLRWMWCSISLAVALGSAALVWSYAPSASRPLNSNSSSTESGDVPATQE